MSTTHWMRSQRRGRASLEALLSANDAGEGAVPLRARVFRPPLCLRARVFRAWPPGDVWRAPAASFSCRQASVAALVEGERSMPNALMHPHRSSPCCNILKRGVGKTDPRAQTITFLRSLCLLLQFARGRFERHALNPHTLCHRLKQLLRLSQM
jgi:hypothetical protein